LEKSATEDDGHDKGRIRDRTSFPFDKELAKFPWLIPAAIAIFGGTFDPEKLTFPHNLLPALKNMPASDVRDWTAIRAWASNLAAQFQPAVAEASDLA
jgi:menaquinone-dependent protoporphyrinogen IX oxidase